jgi:hypothetical protein
MIPASATERRINRTFSWFMDCPFSVVGAVWRAFYPAPDIALGADRLPVLHTKVPDVSRLRPTFWPQYPAPLRGRLTGRSRGSWTILSVLSVWCGVPSTPPDITLGIGHMAGPHTTKIPDPLWRNGYL